MMVRTVHLHGELGERYGGPFVLHVDSVAEAVRALQANFGDFCGAIRDGAYRIVHGPDPAGGEDLDEDLLAFNLGAGDLHIVPVLAGSGGNGKGIVTAVLGVALIGVAFMTGWGAMAAPIFTKGLGATVFGTLTYGQLAVMGGVLAVGGIFQALTPAPAVKSYDREEARPSFLFSGPVNRMEQGGPIPLCFGRFRVGSTTVSAGIDVEEMA